MTAPPIAEEVASTKESDDDGDTEDSSTETVVEATSLIQRFAGRNAEVRAGGRSEKESISKEKQNLLKKLGKDLQDDTRHDDDDETPKVDYTQELVHEAAKIAVPVLDFNQRIAEQEALKSGSGGHALEGTATDHITGEAGIQSLSPLGTTSVTRVPSKRNPPEIATITIGSKTIVSSIGTPSTKRQKVDRQLSRSMNRSKPSEFGSRLRAFAAPGTELEGDAVDTGNEEEEEEEQEEEGRGISHGTCGSDQAGRSELKDASADVDSEVGSSSDDVVAEEPPTGDLSLEACEEDSDGNDEKEMDNRAQEDVSDEDYLDEVDNRAQEEAKVAELIQRAEEDAARPSQDNEMRAKRLLRGRVRKDSTIQLVQAVNINIPDIAKLLDRLAEALGLCEETVYDEVTGAADSTSDPESAEQYLSLTVVKDDFARMRIVGQFNLGFILATRPANPTDNAKPKSKDEVFIVDQHASDEKYNFERLQSETTVQNQPLVKPHFLDLTAMEEEILMGNLEALEKNGFLVEVDDSGDAPVGRRCRLVSLPMSREVVFNTRDLEELLALLAESPPSTSSMTVPRPGKVRRMFAMRACRSSVMVGKTLTRTQMSRIVTHMGEIDKPWNCPHGRPTMRHLMGLDTWESWREGHGIAGLRERVMGVEEEEEDIIWARFIEKAKIT